MGAYINESEREENTRVRLDPRIDEIKRASKIKKTIEKLLPCVFCRIHFDRADLERGKELGKNEIEGDDLPPARPPPCNFFATFPRGLVCLRSAICVWRRLVGRG